MVWLALIFLAVMAPALPHAFMTLPDEAAGQVAVDGGGGDATYGSSAAREPASDPGAESATSEPRSLPQAESRRHWQHLGLVNDLAVVALLLLAAPFWIEAFGRLAYIERGRPGDVVPRPSRGRVLYILCCALVPPLRAGLHPASMRGHMWLPLFGWRRTSLRLSRRVQKAFGVPMLGIGLLILPVLIGEIFFSRQVQASPGLALGLDVATRLIWLAFALEFVVMMAVTPRRTEYAMRHWVDVVIILLPFVAFLRSLQMLRAGQVLRAQRMSQFARVYRLRGVAVKLLQAVLMLRVLEGLSERAARRRIAGIREQIRYRQAEVVDLHEELRQLRGELAQKKRKRLERRRRRRRTRAPQGSAPAGEPASSRAVGANGAAIKSCDMLNSPAATSDE